MMSTVSNSLAFCEASFSSCKLWSCQQYKHYLLMSRRLPTSQLEKRPCHLSFQLLILMSNGITQTLTLSIFEFLHSDISLYILSVMQATVAPSKNRNFRSKKQVVQKWTLLEKQVVVLRGTDAAQ